LCSSIAKASEDPESCSVKIGMAAKGAHFFARCEYVSRQRRWQIVLQTCVAKTGAVDVSLTLDIAKDPFPDLHCNSFEADTRLYFKPKSSNAWCSQGRQHTIAHGMWCVDCTQT